MKKLDLKNINFSKYYDDAMFVGLAILIVMVLYFLYNNFLKKDSNEKEVDESLLTLTDREASLIADNLFIAMKNDRFTGNPTDEDAIYSEFEKISNQDDMILVSNKFGLKHYLLGGYDSTGLLGISKNLKGWILEEMTESEIEPIKTKLNWI